MGLRPTALAGISKVAWWQRCRYSVVQEERLSTEDGSV